MSVSLSELTELCARHAGRRVPITGVAQTRVADVPVYLTDARRVRAELGWAPRKSADDIVRESVEWILARREELLQVFDTTGERRRAASAR